jgi:N-methylhydantoinase A
MVQTLNLMLDGLDAPALERRMHATAHEASAVIAASGIPVERMVDCNLSDHAGVGAAEA